MADVISSSNVSLSKSPIREKYNSKSGDEVAQSARTSGP